MGAKLRALVISCREDLFQNLQAALNGAGIASELAPTCRQAREILEQPNSPELVFSEVSLPDGTLPVVIWMAAQKTAPAPVIVISEVMDYQTFMDAIEAGAADFIAPPFAATDLAWVVTSVLESMHYPAYQVA